MIGQKENIAKLKELFKTNNLIQIYGPCGVGKTFCVKTLAAEMKLCIVEPDNNDKLKNVLINKTIDSYFSVRNLILLDNVKFGKVANTFDKQLIKKCRLRLVVVINNEKIKLAGSIEIEFKPELDSVILKSMPNCKNTIKSARGDIRTVQNATSFWQISQPLGQAPIKSVKDKVYDRDTALNKVTLRQKDNFDKLAFYDEVPELPDFIFENYLNTKTESKYPKPDYLSIADSFSLSDVMRYSDYAAIFSVVSPGISLYGSYIPYKMWPKDWNTINKRRANQKLLNDTKVDRLWLEYYDIDSLVKDMGKVQLAGSKRKTSKEDGESARKKVRFKLQESIKQEEEELIAKLQKLIV